MPNQLHQIRGIIPQALGCECEGVDAATRKQHIPMTYLLRDATGQDYFLGFGCVSPCEDAPDLTAMHLSDYCWEQATMVFGEDAFTGRGVACVPDTVRHTMTMMTRAMHEALKQQQ